MRNLSRRGAGGEVREIREAVLWFTVLLAVLLIGAAMWCAALYYSWNFLSSLL